MLREERINDLMGSGVIWWTRLPWIPDNVEEAKRLEAQGLEGNIVFICDTVVARGKSTLQRLKQKVIEKNPGKKIAIWHNERRDKMEEFHNGKMVHAL